MSKNVYMEKTMRRIEYKRGTAVILALMLMINACFSYLYPAMEAYAYTARSATIQASGLNVRSGAGTSHSTVAKLSRGAAVTVIDETTASDGNLWYQIRFNSGGSELTGYVLGSYVSFAASAGTSDASFEAYLNAQGFPESYKAGLRQLHSRYPSWVFKAQHTNLDWNTVIKEESVLPRSLVHKNSISSWKSIADGAYNWDNSSWPGFDGNSWVAASDDIVRYYMDPRNFLDETYVFQFLTQSYDSTAHTAAGLESMLKGTFMESKVTGTAPSDTTPSGGGTSMSGPGVGSTTPAETTASADTVTGGEPQVGTAPPGSTGSSQNNGGQSSGGDGVSLQGPSASISRHDVNRVLTAIGPGMSGGPGAGSGGSGSSGNSGSAPESGSTSYADIIMNAGVQSGVNPYVLAAMIIQEQGKDGKSDLISGRYSGYEGYYNFFNIEAYASGSMGAVQRGLWYASGSGSYGRPWNSVEKAILGGALSYGTNYVKAGQDTFYLKKFNVQGSNLYKHQYMTNIQAAASEGALYAKAYTAELKNTALEFKIPVYLGMPDSPCAKPTLDGSPNNKLAGLGVNGFALTPTFNRDTASYDLIVNTSVADVTVNATAIDSSAVVSGAGQYNLQSGNNQIRISVKAQNGTVRDYVINVVRQPNGPVNDGSVNNGMTGGTSGGGNSGSSGGPGVTGPGASGSNTGSGSGGNDSVSGGGPGSSGAAQGGASTGNGPGGSSVTIVQ